MRKLCLQGSGETSLFVVKGRTTVCSREKNGKMTSSLLFFFLIFKPIDTTGNYVTWTELLFERIMRDLEWVSGYL
jgi:hypothetical protein